MPVPARTALFLQARRDPALVVLEGFHPLKHALRFGAQLVAAVTPDRASVLGLAAALAPDLLADLPGLLEEMPAAEFARLAPSPPPTPVIAVAVRPAGDATTVLARPGPVVLLDRPNHLGNLGAAVRAAAAAGAAGVLTTGERDPWAPAALRGSAGLHFALPVCRVPALPGTSRPLVAVHPDGASLWTATLPDDAVFAFGGERRGLHPDLLAAAAATVGLPMEPGVSSLNLATAAAVVLYEARRRQTGP